MQSADAQKFTDTCFDYDQITKLDPLRTTMLLKVKSTLKADSVL